MKFLKKNWGTTKPSVGYGVDWSDPISKGLVGCWLFNEGAGAFAFDIARKNKGTLTNGPTWTSGRFGKGLSFDGTNDYVSAGNIGNVQNFSYWIKPSVNKYSLGISANKRYLLNNGLYGGVGTATRYIGGAIPTAESLGSELLTNGTLETGAISPWTANPSNGAAGTVTITSSSPYAGTYAADANITNAGTANWHFQMYHNSNVSMTSGNLYKVQFAAKGSVAKSNLAVSILETTGFTAMGPSYAFDLTTSWVLHTYYFYSEQTKSDVKLYFNLGANGVYHAYFDNISIESDT